MAWLGQTAWHAVTHLAVLDLAVLGLGLDARLVDPLHAIGALLHDAAAAHASRWGSEELQAGV